MNILLGVSLVTQLLCAFILVRNSLVFLYLRQLLQEISIVAEKAIEQGKPWQIYYTWFDSASYLEMLLKFWRRLDSFYPDRNKWLS